MQIHVTLAYPSNTAHKHTGKYKDKHKHTYQLPTLNRKQTDTGKDTDTNRHTRTSSQINDGQYKSNLAELLTNAAKPTGDWSHRVHKSDAYLPRRV